MAFGHSLHIDFYNVESKKCDDLNFFYNLLEKLVSFLGMHKQAPPYIFRSPTDEFPDKAGLSGWIPLIESGISVHTLVLQNFVTIDLYTCGKLDPDSCIPFLCKELQTFKYEVNYLIRGIEYEKKANTRNEQLSFHQPCKN